MISHKLFVCWDAQLISHKKRKVEDKESRAAKEEAEKLLGVGFIKEANYTTWLENMVMVKKNKTGCAPVTLISIKMFPKDTYPLLNID